MSPHVTIIGHWPMHGVPLQATGLALIERGENKVKLIRSVFPFG